MFKILAKFFGGGRTLRPAPAPSHPAPGAPSSPVADKPEAVAAWEQAARRRIDRNAPPEQLCGLNPGMSRNEVREQLAMLYRRHNRAASSLDATLREEAEIMLDAVVRCREKLLDSPAAKPSAHAAPAKAGPGPSLR